MSYYDCNQLITLPFLTFLVQSAGSYLFSTHDSAGEEWNSASVTLFVSTRGPPRLENVGYTKVKGLRVDGWGSPHHIHTSFSFLHIKT